MLFYRSAFQTHCKNKLVFLSVHFSLCGKRKGFKLYRCGSGIMKLFSFDSACRLILFSFPGPRQKS